MIYVGIDDTDMPDRPGTNKLARALTASLPDKYTCVLIVRHQLLDDPRVPSTSKNSAAAILLESNDAPAIEPLVDLLRDGLRERFVEGSDPGLCVTTAVPKAVSAFGRRTQCELVDQQDARALAAKHGIFLEGLGGTEDGVIGALAAVGLAAGGNDGRVVQIGAWPDDLCGPQDIDTVHERGVAVCCLDTGNPVSSGRVDLGKRLRPNYRRGRIVLYATPVPAESAGGCDWRAIRMT